MGATKKKPIYQNCVEIFELIMAYSTDTEISLMLLSSLAAPIPAQG